MNEVVNKILLAGAKFMPNMYLKQPGFVYSACGPFIKNKEKIQKFKETGNSQYIYQNELNKSCFQHDMAYGYFKDLPEIPASDKILRYKVFNIDLTSKNPKYDRSKRSCLIYIFFDKKSASSGDVKNELVSNREINRVITKINY